MAKKKNTGRKARPKKPLPVIPLGGNVKAKTLEELAAEQGVKPIEDVEAFLASGKGIWRDDREIDDFIAWVRRGRQRGWYD